MWVGFVGPQQCAGFDVIPGLTFAAACLRPVISRPLMGVGVGSFVRFVLAIAALCPLASFSFSRFQTILEGASGAFERSEQTNPHPRPQV